MMVFMLRSYDRQESQIAKSRLAEIVADQSEMISHDGKNFVLDKHLNFYRKETYISVYTRDGYFIAGRRPTGITEFPDFDDKKLSRIKDEKNREWYIYDSTYNVDGERVWIRGIMNNSISGNLGGYTVKLYMILLPGLLLVALLGGYLITKGALSPIRKIIKVADDIKEDGVLSRRIEADGSRGEAVELTRSINEMFDQIEEVLEREKQYTNEVAHEVRTPLAVIRAQSEYALENPENSAEALRSINRQAKDMTIMVNRILTLFKSDAGTLHMETEDIDCSSLLEDIVEQQQMILEEQGTEITSDIQKSIHIRADESLLIRVILNLFSNAAKHARQPNGRIHVSLSNTNMKTVFIIADNGAGIPEQQRDKIWQRFYQGEQSGRSEGSAGLGLPMVKSFTELMGGSVRLMDGPLNEELTGAAFELVFSSEEVNHEK